MDRSANTSFPTPVSPSKRAGKSTSANSLAFSTTRARDGLAQRICSKQSRDSFPVLDRITPGEAKHVCFVRPAGDGNIRAVPIFSPPSVIGSSHSGRSHSGSFIFAVLGNSSLSAFIRVFALRSTATPIFASERLARASDLTRFPLRSKRINPSRAGFEKRFKAASKRRQRCFVVRVASRSSIERASVMARPNQ